MLHFRSLVMAYILALMLVPMTYSFAHAKRCYWDADLQQEICRNHHHYYNEESIYGEPVQSIGNVYPWWTNGDRWFLGEHQHVEYGHGR